LELWQQEFVDVCAPAVNDMPLGSPARVTVPALSR
jgi:hypothetical protein